MLAMLSAAELTMLRIESDRHLPDVCIVEPIVTTYAADGSHTQSYGDPVTVACRVAPSGYQAGSGQAGGQVQELGSWTLTFPANTDVPKSSRVTNQTLGTKYEVVGVSGPRSDEISRRVYAQETKA